MLVNLIWPVNVGDTFHVEYYSGYSGLAYTGGDQFGQWSKLQVTFLGPL